MYEQAKSLGYRRYLWLAPVLLAAILVRLYHIGDPSWDYHNWRQTITLMVARDFARHGFNILYPKVLWLGSTQPPAQGYFSAEFSFQSIVTALLYKILGESDAIARSVVIAFSLLGIYSLYNLLYRRAGAVAAGLGAFVYALLPYHVFFGRVFMPDVPAISLALGGLDALDRWTEEQSWRGLITATILISLAILQKLTVVFVLLPAFYLIWTTYRGNVFKRPQLYVFGAIALLPSLFWYRHAVNLAHRSGFSIMQPGYLGNHLGLWLQPHFLADTAKGLTEAFSPIGLILSAAAILWSIGDRAARVFQLWLAGAAALLVLIPDPLPQNHYYFLVLLPGSAALAGIGFSAISRTRVAFPVLALVLIVFTASVIRSARPLYEPDRIPYELGQLLNRMTGPDDLLLTESGGSPNVLYYADRKGWMVGGMYDPEFVERFAKAGASYYADMFESDRHTHPDFFRALDGRFERVSPASAPWTIYRLQQPAAQRESR